MTELMQASRQWATRPADERFLSLLAMRDAMYAIRSTSRAVVVPSRKLTALPTDSDHRGLAIAGPNGHPYAPTNWAFGQLCSRVKAPAGYLRTLPAELACDNLNYGLQIRGMDEDAGDVGCLIQANGEHIMRAATGPTYGRIWNLDVVDALISRFGDGVTGMFRVPGEFGRQVTVTKENTTLYASDRDMFVFLADEENRVEVPNRRDGRSGSLARGFFVKNSEVGNGCLELMFFLFDYACCNRIVWGAQDVKTFKIRHTSGAPERFVEEAAPIINSFTLSSSRAVTQAIEDARAKRLEDKTQTFLAQRFGKGLVDKIMAVHQLEENRPIETAWDAVVGATAYARSLSHIDARLAIEEAAGNILTA